jgi:hypothetical protein
MPWILLFQSLIRYSKRPGILGSRRESGLGVLAGPRCQRPVTYMQRFGIEIPVESIYGRVRDEAFSFMPSLAYAERPLMTADKSHVHFYISWLHKSHFTINTSTHTFLN